MKSDIFNLFRKETLKAKDFRLIVDGDFREVWVDSCESKIQINKTKDNFVSMITIMNKLGNGWSFYPNKKHNAIILLIWSQGRNVNQVFISKIDNFFLEKRN